MSDRDFSGAMIRERIRGLTKRKPKTREHITVMAGLCNGCALCACFCPSGSWELKNKSAVWEYGMEYCLECGMCFNICPRGAIAWSYPLGGEGVIYDLG